MVEHNATCCPKLYAVLLAAEAFCEEVQEDHPAIDALRLRTLNLAIDAARGKKPHSSSGGGEMRTSQDPGRSLWMAYCLECGPLIDPDDAVYMERAQAKVDEHISRGHHAGIRVLGA